MGVRRESAKVTCVLLVAFSKSSTRRGSFLHSPHSVVKKFMWFNNPVPAAVGLFCELEMSCLFVVSLSVDGGVTDGSR